MPMMLGPHVNGEFARLRASLLASRILSQFPISSSLISMSVAAKPQELLTMEALRMQEGKLEFEDIVTLIQILGDQDAGPIYDALRRSTFRPVRLDRPEIRSTVRMSAALRMPTKKSG